MSIQVKHELYKKALSKSTLEMFWTESKALVCMCIVLWQLKTYLYNKICQPVILFSCYFSWFAENTSTTDMTSLT